MPADTVAGRSRGDLGKSCVTRSAQSHFQLMTARSFRKGLPVLWSTLQIILLAYRGVTALNYFNRCSLVFLPSADRHFRASPADIGLAFTPLKLSTADSETIDD
jgi:hypothetical protein